MKLFISCALFAVFLVHAQEKSNSNFNRWSVEVNVGQNKAIRPFSSGYFSSNPDKYFNINGLEHFDIGTRYMFSTSFGLKLDYAYDVIKNNNDISLPFKNVQYRIGLQGISNLGRMMQFETFTNRFGLLAHAGIQISTLNPKLGFNAGNSEQNGGLIFGLTPQFRLMNSIVITADFSAINNVRQHFNWDGSYAATDNNLTGLMYNTSLGITYYIGKKEKHADWYITYKESEKVDNEARKRIEEIETLMNDTDKDGIADYLDQENNTPAGVAVDSRGKFIDLNGNGVPDEMERKKTDIEIVSEGSKSDAIKELISRGYVNIFFNINEDEPNSGSTNSIYNIVKFLKLYPDTKIILTGYSDASGDENKNISLSNRRAQNVSKIIYSSGVSKDRIQVVGQGVDNSYPLDTKSGLNLARRVSISIK
jgi:OOP family OmpA-OmpF porin